MNETCNDNRFKLIEKANIDISYDEMKMLDNFFFKCWQIGRSEKYNGKKKLEYLINENELECINNLIWCLDLSNNKFIKIEDLFNECSSDNISSELEKMCESLERFRGE